MTVILCIATVIPAFAQITTSNIIGNVSDGSQPISTAIVTVVHDQSGISYYAITNNRGNYVINDIIAGGPYTMRVERQNYNTLIIKDIEALLGEAVVVDVELSPASIRLEEITVSSNGSNMNVNRSGAGVHLGPHTMELVPNVDRKLNDILRLTPQSISTGDGFSVGGGNYRSSVVSVDGASFNNTFGIGSSLPAGGTPIS